MTALLAEAGDVADCSGSPWAALVSVGALVLLGFIVWCVSR